jgi:hypothetical protein
MTSIFRLATAFAFLLCVTAPVAAQAPASTETPPPATPAKAETDNQVESLFKGRPITMQHFRPQDKRGINIFETPKEPGVEYTGFKLDFGAAFTSQVQSLEHTNTAGPNMVNGVNANQLANIGFGFNNSAANLYLHAQLAKGIRVALTSYLSSRHHPEAWVKDGYLLIDGSPIDWVPMHAIMQFFTLRLGHMEVNYGDAHFRRSDNGNAIYNPFVGNYILDAFTTEMGAEVYFRANSIIAMAAVTGGELRGTVLSPEQRGLAHIGKLGFDRQVKKDVRVRLTGSLYKADKSMSNTLYGGDRAGSRYYYVMENTAATESAQASSGLINPGLRNSVTAMQINPFVKMRGLEVFGVIERAEGKATAETDNRVWKQFAADVVYRFLADEKLFVGARYNKVEGQLAGIANDVGANRWQLAGGWFITPALLMKAEYVTQKYVGFPVGNIRNGGKFNGMMLEGVVAF